MAELDPEVAAAVEAGRVAIEQGDILPLQISIPDPRGGAWRLVIPDLEATGRNNAGVRYRPMVYAAVAALVMAVDAESCFMISDSFVTQTADPDQPVPDLSLDPDAGEALLAIVMGRGLWGQFTQTYHRDDAGRIVWEAPRYTETSQPAPADTLVLWHVLQDRPPIPAPPIQLVVSELRRRDVVVIPPGEEPTGV
jgi:hypothetical protein